jgi:hypothetical protein
MMIVVRHEHTSIRSRPRPASGVPARFSSVCHAARDLPTRRGLPCNRLATPTMRTISSRALPPSRIKSLALLKAVHQEQSMPIDFSTVNWLFVAIMAVFAFVASLIGGLISFRNRIGGALIAAILFAAMYVVWNYYPHPQIQLPVVSAYSTPSGG